MSTAIHDRELIDARPAEQARSLSELPQFFRRIAQYPDEFIVYDDGFRGFTYRYPDIGRMANSLAARLRAHGIRKGDAVMIWSESRPGWVAALWACLLDGAIVVPIEPQSSIELFDKIRHKVRSHLLLQGDHVPNIATTGELEVWHLSEIEQFESTAELDPIPMYASDIAEIVFTSGTTAEPKGVVITHRNLAAQIPAIEEQFAPYRKYVRPFAPLHFLNLLPLSHLFGQSLATFVLPLIPAPVVFISGTSPHEIVRQIRLRRITALVSVPKILEVLRDYVLHRFPQAGDVSRSSDPWPLRWWRFRAVHWMFGWKFCCLVSGGAPLPPDLERFWMNLGFAVIQGYGLTETAPVISFSHPFHFRHETAGKPLAGVDVQIAEDGEVLVRGNNVTPGYFEAPQQTAEAFRGGWFHTGDFGKFDAEGNLIIRGRKKEMIVTPEGQKVFPEDVEAVLNRLPGVRESAVIGKDRVQAVLVLEPGIKSDDVVRQANAKLEEHQKIRSASLWAGAELPRTETTRKLRRGEIASAIDQTGKGSKSEPPADGSSRIAGLIAKYAPGRTIGPETTIEELGLSSLDRVELMMDLEEKLGASMDESAFASLKKVGDLSKALPSAEETPFPRYNRTLIAKLIRGISLEAVFLPIVKMFAQRKVSGLENLGSLRGPVIFAANHQSHFDTPIVLASLPPHLRRTTAPAMWKEYFDAHFHPDRHSRAEHWTNSLLYGLITLLFNGFPIPQTEAGAGESIRYMGELVEGGWSILIFPEGERSTTGEIGQFFPGVGMIASRLQIPVVPIRLRGVDRVLPRNARWPHPGPVEVRFGTPLRLHGDSYPALARQVEEAVQAL